MRSTPQVTASSRPTSSCSAADRQRDPSDCRFQGHNGGVPTTIEPTRVEEPDVDEHVAEEHPWVVIVWNDPVNLMSYVTYVLQKLFGYSNEKATELMLDVHHKGKAVVANGTREQAEMHVYRLHEHGLWASMEKDGE